MSVKRKRQSSTASYKSAARKKRSAGRKPISEVLLNLVLPLMLIVVILGALGFLGYIGYKGVSKSEFFRLNHVEANGISKIQYDEVKGVVEANAQKGLWAASLEDIQVAILTKFAYTKTVAVSRQFPDTITVSIVERVPEAIVQIGDSYVWVDDQAVELGPVREDRTGWFPMTGWDTTAKGSPGYDRAERENKERVKLYRKAKEEWSTLDLISRLSSIDISNLNELKVYVEKGGRVEVNLGKDDFGVRLKDALTSISGTDKSLATVDMRVSPPVSVERSSAGSRNQRTENQNPTTVDKKEPAKNSKPAPAKDKKSDSKKKN